MLRNHINNGQNLSPTKKIYGKKRKHVQHYNEHTINACSKNLGHIGSLLKDPSDLELNVSLCMAPCSTYAKRIWQFEVF